MKQFVATPVQLCDQFYNTTAYNILQETEKREEKPKGFIFKKMWLIQTLKGLPVLLELLVLKTRSDRTGMCIPMFKLHQKRKPEEGKISLFSLKCENHARIKWNN
jgi:hypothetical protein